MLLGRRSFLATLALGAGACSRRGGPTPSPAVVRDVRVGAVTLRTVELPGPGRTPRYVLHGGPGLDHTYLRPWFDGLASDAPVVYVDLRGHGRSSAPPEAEGYTLEDAAADLVALAHTRGDTTVDVIAHDFGAAVAMLLAARHGEVLRRLVLVDPLRDAEQVRAVATRSRDVLGEAGWRGVQELSTPQGTLRDARTAGLLFHRLGHMWWHTVPDRSVTDAMASGMIYRPEADANFVAAAMHFDAMVLAPDVRAPALVVSGDDDRTFHADESRALAERLPHGRFEAIAAAGHLPFVERPEAFRAVLRAFLRD